MSEPPGVGEQPNIPDEPRTLSSEERRGRRGRRRGRRGGRRGRDRDGPRAPGEEHQTEDNLGNGAGLDLAEPTAAEPDAAPFAEPAPLTEPVPLADPAPLAEPVPPANWPLLPRGPLSLSRPRSQSVKARRMWCPRQRVRAAPPQPRSAGRKHLPRPKARQKKSGPPNGPTG